MNLQLFGKKRVKRVQTQQWKKSNNNVPDSTCTQTLLLLFIFYLMFFFLCSFYFEFPKGNYAERASERFVQAGG